jgi:hypothetical protein
VIDIAGPFCCSALFKYDQETGEKKGQRIASRRASARKKFATSVSGWIINLYSKFISGSSGEPSLSFMMTLRLIMSAAVEKS